MIQQIATMALIPLVITVLFSLTERFMTQKGLTPSVPYQILMGLLWGGAAVICTELGLSWYGNTIDVSAAVLICSVFVSGRRSTLIAALISVPVSVWLLFHHQMPELAVPYAIYLIGAGVGAILLQKMISFRRKPAMLTVFMFCTTLVGTYLLTIFFFNWKNLLMAYYIVQDAASFLFSANILVTILALPLAALLRNDPYRYRKNREHSLRFVIERYLNLCIVAAYLVTGLLTYLMLDNTVMTSTENTLNVSVHDLIDEIEKSKYKAIMNLLFQLCDLGDSDYAALMLLPADKFPDINHNRQTDAEDIAAVLQEYCKHYTLQEIQLLSADGTVLYSNQPDTIGQKFDTEEMHISIETSLAEGQTSAKSSWSLESVSDVFQGVAFLQIVYGQPLLDGYVENYIYDSSRMFLFGMTGSIQILSAEPDPNNKHYILNQAWSDTDLPDGLDHALFEHPQETLFETTIGEISMMAIWQPHDGFYYLACISQEEAMESRNIAIVLMQLMAIAIFALIIICLDMVIYLHITRNLNKINHRLGEICKGNLEVTFDVYNNRDFATLSEDITLTVNTLKQYIAAEAARIDKDLALAHDIQASALPHVFPPFPDKTSFDIFASMTPAKEVGGDFYDFYFTADNRLAFVVADVSGKGIPAALFMMTAKTMLKNLALEGIPIEEIFRIANQRLYESNSAEMFVTAWMGILDLSTGRLQYVNASHNPPLLCRSGQWEYLRERSGFVLAGMPNMKYKPKELMLNPQDQLLLYTDGVVEAADKQLNLYGEKRLLELLTQNSTQNARRLCTKIKADVDRYSQGCEQADDITLLSLQYFGESGSAKRSDPL